MRIDTRVRWIEFLSESVDRDGRLHFFLHWLQRFPSDPARHLPVEIDGTLWWPKCQVFWANPNRQEDHPRRVGRPPWMSLPRVPVEQWRERVELEAAPTDN